MAATTIVMSSSDYEDFLRCLLNLKDLCTDVDLREGIIRQRTNDNNSIFEFDLTPLIQNVSLPLSDLKHKLDLFKVFSGQEVTINSDDVNFSFSDQYSSIKVKNPLPDFLDNKFIPETELNAIIAVPENSLILEHNLLQIITERIKIITQGFNTPSIQVSFEAENAKIMAATQSKEESAIFVSGLVTNTQMEQSMSSMSINPFTIDHDDDIKLEIFRDNNNLLNKFSTTIGQIGIKMYSKSMLRIEAIE